VGYAPIATGPRRLAAMGVEAQGGDAGMCGICGFTGATDGEEDCAIVEAMCNAMAHRGPDGEGVYLADGIALGHRRLALIDLEGGAQPLVRPDGGPEDAGARAGSDSDGSAMRGRWSIVFNGEIYNYRELREELAGLGHTFATDSDTEVLLVGYIEWGEGVLERVRGMFAFAVYDADERELFCARDPFGIKPFYYTFQERSGTVAPQGEAPSRQFVFASEIKSILEHPAYERVLNEEALAQYLCFQFSALPETFFKGVFKLLPGHFMRVHADGSAETSRYWRPSYAFDETRTEEETAEAIDRCMRESVRYHNVADVEVGSFLSSGIDSSYLAACLAKENPSIKTFTVGFAEYEGERDEISWARELAGMIEVENDSRHISEEEFWQTLPLVQWHMDEPSADPSAVALYFVDELAARRVKAVLSGEGADEFFGGYRVYQAPLDGKRVGHVPKPLLRAGSRALRAAGRRGANYLERASERVEDWYYTNANGVAFSPEERGRILSEGLRARLAGVPTPQELTAPVYAEVASLDDVTRMQHVDLWFWLAGDILLKTDKMAMAHSLESRVPFLDREVFRLASTVPTPQKVGGGQTKRALRRAAEGAVPREWAQKEKLGFPVPLASWLREERYCARVREEFSSPEAVRFFDTGELLRLLEEHRAGTADNSRRIWIVYSFLMWYRIFFVDRAKPARPAPQKDGR